MKVSRCFLSLVLLLVLVVLASHLPMNAQSVPCSAITRNPLVLEALLDSHSQDSDSDLLDDTINAAQLEHLQFKPIVIQPGDALYVEYRGRDFTVDADFASGERTAFDSSPKGSYEEWRKGILPLDMFREALSQRLIRLRASAKSPNQVLFRNVKIIRAGKPVFEFSSLASYGKPRIRRAIERQLPCVGYDDVPANGNSRAVNYSFPNPVPLPSFSGGLAQPMLPPFPMMMQSTSGGTDANHYKFTGKELDDETGLYNYGARYYSPALGRYMTPDWSTKPVPIPYADVSNPQTLNLYNYGRNNPTTLADKDGHCPGDDCSKVKVEVTVTSPAKIVQNEKQPGPTVDYATGVRANVQYTITDNGKALSNTAVAEKNTATRTLNGEQRPGKLDEQNESTNSKGQVNDTFGLLSHSDTPLSAADNKGFVDVLSNNSVTVTGTQTLTFPDQAGTTCSCTVDRTLTNQNKDGTNNGSNYTFTTSQPSQPKPVQQPKEKQPQ